MKLSSRRPISGPGRMEKFPPPLTSFLRTSTASRSRGSRSLASPIFIKQRTAGGADTKEPSSPKVTCMGQVRARRSKQGQRKTGQPRRRRCRCIPRIMHCQGFICGTRVRFPLFRLSSCCAPGWPKWGSLFRFGSRGGSGKWGFGSTEEDFRDGRQDVVREDEYDGEMESKASHLGSSPCLPPKNALILTRCRSTPYTSSSLTCRFGGSTFEPEKTEPRLSKEETEPRLCSEKAEQVSRRSADNVGERIEMTNSSDRIPPDGECDVDSKTTNPDGMTSSYVEGEDEAGAKSESDEHRQTLPGDTDVEAARPLMLTRCKSEPARTAEKVLDPEATGSAGGGFWRKTKLGVADSCSPRLTNY